MLIIGAKGLAKELAEIVYKQVSEDDIYFYDDISTDLPDLLFDKFKILRTEDQVKELFKTNGDFTIGIGNPGLRRKMYDKFHSLGGRPVVLISENAEVGSFDNKIGDGSVITSGCILTNSITLGKGCLINLNVTIGHDCKIGNFVEITPNVNISGHCEIADNVFIGTCATIIPKIKVGANSVIAAGSVVTKDVPPNVMVAGVPATIKKHL